MQHFKGIDWSLYDPIIFGTTLSWFVSNKIYEFRSTIKLPQCRIDAKREWHISKILFLPAEWVCICISYHSPHSTVHTISMSTSFVHPREVYNLTKCISRMHFRQTNGRLNYKSDVLSFRIWIFFTCENIVSHNAFVFLPNNESNDRIISHPSKSQWMWVHFALMHGPPLCSLSIPRQAKLTKTEYMMLCTPTCVHCMPLVMQCTMLL